MRIAVVRGSLMTGLTNRVPLSDSIRSPNVDGMRFNVLAKLGEAVTVRPYVTFVVHNCHVSQLRPAGVNVAQRLYRGSNGNISRNIPRKTQHHHLLQHDKTLIRFCSSKSSASQSQSQSPLAWQIGQYGGNSTLKLTECQMPVIKKANEVLIKVHAASVNPIDVKNRSGYGAVFLNKARGVKPGDEFPLTLGRDCSGVVAEIGRGVRDIKEGDNVWTTINAVRQGTFADYVIATTDEVGLKPSNLTHIEAASIPYVATTNWSAIYAVAKIRPANALGKRALILGGSGGVGTFGIQLLKAWGVNVTVTCSENAFDLVYGLGAHHAVDYKSPNILEELLKHGQYDLIVNTIGESMEDMSVKLIKEKAYAQYVTLVAPFIDEMEKKGLFAGGLSSSLMLFQKSRKFSALGGTYRWAFAQPNSFALKEVAKLVEDGKIKPVIDETFDFQDLPAAFERVEKGHLRGKVVVNVAHGDLGSHVTGEVPRLFDE